MNLVGLLFFGFILFFIFSIYGQHVNKYSSVISYRKNKFIELPFFFLVLFGFICISSFQFIDTSAAAVWTNGGINNDMSRYKIGFDKIRNMSYMQAFKVLGQEPLYVLYVYIFSHITTHFSVVLFFTYSFNLVVLYYFIKKVGENFNYIYLISSFAMIYTMILTSFCLFRMGIAFSFILLAYINILEQNMKKTLVLICVAVGFHISAVFVLGVLILYLFSLKYTYKKFAFICILSFCTMFIVSRFVVYVLKSLFISKLVYLNGGIAKSTYLTNFALILLCIPFIKEIYENRKLKLMFCIVIGSFFVLPIQMVAFIFYRMIYFTYPGVVGIIVYLYKKYNKTVFSYFCVRGGVLFYLTVYLYKFCTSSWYSYGLNTYKLFYFY